MNTQTVNTTETQAEGAEKRHYKKTVLEMYTEAADKVANSNRHAQQVSASGNSFGGMNNNILATAKAELEYTSNVWFTEKQMAEQGLTLKEGEKYGVALFNTKLVDIEGSNKKEKVLRYWTVFNNDQLEVKELTDAEVEEAALKAEAEQAF
jgi:antirestriction protein ArdC